MGSAAVLRVQNECFGPATMLVVNLCSRPAMARARVLEMIGLRILDDFWVSGPVLAQIRVVRKFLDSSQGATA